MGGLSHCFLFLEGMWGKTNIGNWVRGEWSLAHLRRKTIWIPRLCLFWPSYFITRASLWLSWWRINLECGRPGFDPWVGKIPWRRDRLSTLVFWPGEFHGVAKSQTLLNDFQFHFTLYPMYFSHLSELSSKIRS